jgi:hypothetical protein
MCSRAVVAVPSISECGALSEARRPRPLPLPCAVYMSYRSYRAVPCRQPLPPRRSPRALCHPEPAVPQRRNLCVAVERSPPWLRLPGDSHRAHPWPSPLPTRPRLCPSLAPSAVAVGVSWPSPQPIRRSSVSIRACPPDVWRVSPSPWPCRPSVPLICVDRWFPCPGRGRSPSPSDVHPCQSVPARRMCGGSPLRPGRVVLSSP